MTIEDKIKKLLALASSPNENEASLAMSRARELMAKYSVSIKETEIHAQEVLNEEYYFSQYFTSAAGRWIPLIVNDIVTNFGVIPYLKEAKIILCGFKTNLNLAIYACDVILNQLNAEYKLEYRNHRTFSFGDAFWQGAASAINRKFTIPQDQQAGLIVYDPVKAKVNEICGNRTTNLSGSSDYLDGVNAGVAAGNNAQLYRGVGETSNKGNLLK